MEIQRLQTSPSEAQQNIPGEELTSALSEKRAQKTLKKPSEAPAEDVDENVGDSDEAVVEEVARDVLDTASDILEDPSAEFVIEGISGKGSDTGTRQILDAVEDRGVTDVQVQAVEAGKHTVITGENGKSKTVKLAKNEKVREVSLGSETVLVVNENLTVSEVETETTQYIVDKIEEIAGEYGLAPTFDPFFNILLDQGFGGLIPYFASFRVPKILRHQAVKIFESDTKVEEQNDALRKQRIDGFGEF